MSRSKQSPRQRSRHPLVTGCVSAAAIALFMWALGEVPLAHEHKHTHQNLTRAAFRLLGLPYERIGGLTLQEIENELAQGVIDEDECLQFDDTGGGHDWDWFPNWNSHFYEAKLRVRLSGPIAGDPFGAECRDLFIQGDHTSAADRARMLYGLAVDDYRDGKYRSAFRVLGRVLHLVEDMTSPAHVHDDPHAELPDVCGGDADDFERWGYCEGFQTPQDDGHRRICEYFHDSATTGYPTKPDIGFPFCVTPPVQECRADFDGDGQLESYGVPPTGFTCRLWSALHILYDGKPQVSWPNPVGENAGYAFVHKLANVTYDFTTFTVHLQDISGGDDPLPRSSELSKMLNGSTVATCSGDSDEDEGICEDTDANGWHINGFRQKIGHTDAQGYSTEFTLPDSNEEWWLMPTGYFYQATGIFPVRDIRIDGFAYFENAGGEGPDEDGTPDNFVPLRYGCTAAETAVDGGLCSENFVGPRSKSMFQTLYGTVSNHIDPFPEVAEVGRSKTLLRIYGDVLYTSAVAYGAGLIQRFINQVNNPTAEAGGPYVAEACQPLTLNGSASTDQQGGTIASYAWDPTADDTLDQTTTTPTTQVTYPAPFTGQLRLRVTDNDGFVDEDTAEVTITPDVTAPVITSIAATPNSLWPVNHTMRPVTITVSVADACADTTCHIVDVTSSDAGEAVGPHRGQPDWVVSDGLTLQLRAERSGAAGDRVYTITLSCADAAGNAITKTVTVTVPHDLGRR